MKPKRRATAIGVYNFAVIAALVLLRPAGPTNI